MESWANLKSIWVFYSVCKHQCPYLNLTYQFLFCMLFSVFNEENESICVFTTFRPSLKDVSMDVTMFHFKLFFEEGLTARNGTPPLPLRSVHHQFSSSIFEQKYEQKSKWRSKVSSTKGESLSLPTTNDRECKTPSISRKQEYQN